CAVVYFVSVTCSRYALASLYLLITQAAPTDIHTLSLHDALPISGVLGERAQPRITGGAAGRAGRDHDRHATRPAARRAPASPHPHTVPTPCPSRAPGPPPRARCRA